MGIIVEPPIVDPGGPNGCWTPKVTPKFLWVSITENKRGPLNPGFDLTPINFVVKTEQITLTSWIGAIGGHTIELSIKTTGPCLLTVIHVSTQIVIFGDVQQAPCIFYYVNQALPTSHVYGGHAGIGWINEG